MVVFKQGASEWEPDEEIEEGRYEEGKFQFSP